jgi:hypothetical protein
MRMTILALGLLVALVGRAEAGTCTNGAGNSGPPPKTDSDGWTMVNNCAGSSAAPTQSVPVGGNVTLTTSAQVVIPAASRRRWSYQAQGTGWACASWVTTAPTISVSAANVATCGGSGSFLVSPGSSANSSDVATPTTPLSVIAAAPNAGTLAMGMAWDAQ